MDNPLEGQGSHPTQNWSNQYANNPNGPTHSDHQKPATPDTPHTSHAPTIILQWLTYAFWGWTVLTFSVLVISVLERLINGQDLSNFNYYVIAALVVLLPIAFICDILYSKKEPVKKAGPSSVVMVIHAVLFALFTIGSLLFAAWSVVSLAIGNIDRSSSTAELLSALLISLVYAATFMRTLNPAHIRWIPKVYRLTMLVLIVIFVILGFVKPTFSSIPKVAPANDTYTPTPLVLNGGGSGSTSGGEQLNQKGSTRPSQYLQICETNSGTEYITQGSPRCLGSDSYEGSYSPGVPGTLFSSPCETTSGTLRYVYISQNESCPDNTSLVFYNNLCPATADSSDDCVTPDSSDTTN